MPVKVLKLAVTTLVPLAVALASPARAAGWSIEKNETDPFDTSKSTFIAATMGGSGGLAIRCLEGTISLVVISGPSNASAGDAVDLKLVADAKIVRAEEDAEVLKTTNFTTAVQFGNDSTLEYLDGAQKLSLRYTLGGATSTETFSGGKSLRDIIAKARKACGLQTSEAPKVGSKP